MAGNETVDHGRRHLLHLAGGGLGLAVLPGPARAWATCLRHALNKLPGQADRRLGLGAPGAAVKIPRPAASVSPAHKPTGSGIGPATAPLCRPHHRDRWSRSMARAFATGSRKRRWAGMRCSPTPMQAMSTRVDQAHNAIDRKLFAMKGFHHPGGSQAAFLTGLAHLYNLIPYQRRALNAGYAGWKSRAGGCQPRTGCSTCKSSLREAISVRLNLPTTKFGGICAG